MPLRSTRALPLAVSALVGGTVCASAVSATRQAMPLPKAVQKAATLVIRIHLPPSCMMRKALAIGCTRQLIDAHPAFRHQPLLRQKTAFVIHLARAADPVAEIHVSKAHASRALDMIENHIRTERTRRFVRFEERIDHRKSVAEHVGERDGDEFAGRALAGGRIPPGPAVPAYSRF